VIDGSSVGARAPVLRFASSRGSASVHPGATIHGVLVVLPIYLAVLFLQRGAQSAANLIRPFTMLLPDWPPAERACLSGWSWRCAS
jgi:hypothetical protein